MSSPDIHVTGYLGAEDHAAVFRFIDAAARLAAFREILPVRRADGRIIAITFVTIVPLEESQMSLIASRLSGILGRDVTIASAWSAPGGRQCTHLVPGGGGAVLGEVIREPPALSA